MDPKMQKRATAALQRLAFESTSELTIGGPYVEHSYTVTDSNVSSAEERFCSIYPWSGFAGLEDIESNF